MADDEERRPAIIVVSPPSSPPGRMATADEDPEALYLTSIAAGLRARRRRRTTTIGEPLGDELVDDFTLPWASTWIADAHRDAHRTSFDELWRNDPVDIERDVASSAITRMWQNAMGAAAYRQPPSTTTTTTTADPNLIHTRRNPMDPDATIPPYDTFDPVSRRRTTGFSMRQTLRMKKDCMLLYCGSSQSTLGHASLFGDVKPRRADRGGCGTLLCARALSGPTFAAFSSNVHTALPSYMSDYPPPVNKVAYVDTRPSASTSSSSSTNNNMMGGVETRLVYLDQPECRGCVVIDIGCKNCGNIVGFRVVNACTDCSKPRATHQGLRWFFDATVLEARHRLYGISPDPELDDPPDSPFDPVDSSDDVDEPNSQQQQQPHETSRRHHMPPRQLRGGRQAAADSTTTTPPVRGSKLKWARIPLPSDDVRAGLASRPIEWSRTAYFATTPANTTNNDDDDDNNSPYDRASISRSLRRELAEADAFRRFIAGGNSDSRGDHGDQDRSRETVFSPRPWAILRQDVVLQDSDDEVIIVEDRPLMGSDTPTTLRRSPAIRFRPSGPFSPSSTTTTTRPTSSFIEGTTTTASASVLGRRTRQMAEEDEGAEEERQHDRSYLGPAFDGRAVRRRLNDGSSTSTPTTFAAQSSQVTSLIVPPRLRARRERAGR